MACEKKKECHDLPGNLLDDLTNEGGALAQVALGARNAGLGDTSSGLLYSGQEGVPRSANIPFFPVSLFGLLVLQESPSSAMTPSWE